MVYNGSVFCLRHMLELLACSVFSIDAWDASLGMMGQTASGTQHTTLRHALGQTSGGSQHTLRHALLDQHPVPPTAQVVNNGALNRGHQGLIAPTDGASLYNEKVLQFCSTVMPLDACRAAAAKALHTEVKPSDSRELLGSGNQPPAPRTLRSMTVRIRSSIDVKRLKKPASQNAAPFDENATGSGDEELALLDLSSAFQSVQGWSVEQVL